MPANGCGRSGDRSWSESALLTIFVEGIEIFVEGIERFGERQALRYRDDLNATFVMLDDLPSMGRAHPEFGDGVRSYPKGTHLILYRPAGDGVLIVRVRDACDDWLRE